MNTPQPVEPPATGLTPEKLRQGFELGLLRALQRVPERQQKPFKGSCERLFRVLPKDITAILLLIA